MLSKHVSICIALSLATAGAFAAPSWNLAGDYLEDTNPNGQWTYGQTSGGTFSALAWNAATSSYGIAAAGETFIYQNTRGYYDFGIDPGKVSLEADWGNPAVRWIAPSSGSYTFAVAIGGSTAGGPGGFGNNFASYAGLTIDGVDRAANSFAGNVKAWSFTEFLGAGAVVVAFVTNPGYANGGNTQTEMAISMIPEPSSIVLMGLGLGALLLRGRRGEAFERL